MRTILFHTLKKLNRTDPNLWIHWSCTTLKICRYSLYKYKSTGCSRPPQKLRVFVSRSQLASRWRNMVLACGLFCWCECSIGRDFDQRPVFFESMFLVFFLNVNCFSKSQYFSKSNTQIQHICQLQFQHTHFRYSFNTYISTYSFNTRISTQTTD